MKDVLNATIIATPVAYVRPKTMGEMATLLANGEECEVVETHVGTVMLKLSWALMSKNMSLNSVTYRPSENQGWTVFSLRRTSALSDFQVKVGTWSMDTFPAADASSQVAHLRKEVEELAESHSPEEAADCLLLLLGHAERKGYDLLAEAQKKHAINLKRKWGTPDTEGVYEHSSDPRHPEIVRFTAEVKAEVMYPEYIKILQEMQDWRYDNVTHDE
jgi:hypothetical protein